MLFGFMRYCFRSPRILRKVSIGFLIFYWKSHFIQMNCYLGIFFGLKANINGLLQMPDNSISKQALTHFVKKLKGNNNNLTKADYYNFVFILPGKNENFLIQARSESLIKNKFFEKNKDQFLPFNNSNNLNQSHLKLKYLDCFATRYVYYGFTRWWTSLKNKIL